MENRQAAKVLAVDNSEAKVENALRQKESELKEAQRLAHIGNWHWDAQSDLMTGSEEIHRIFGLDPSNPISIPWHKHRGRLWPAEEWERVNFAMRHALQTGQPYKLDVQVLHPDGTRAWAVARGEPVRNAEGRIVGLRGTLQDITERKLAEEVLRESERRLRQFIEHAPVSLAMFDREMRYLAVSQSWQEQYAPGQPSLIGQSHYELWPDMPQHWIAAHRRGLAGEVVTCDEDAFIGRNNTLEWARWEVRPWRAPNGTIGGIVIMTENITRRKQAEEALRRSEHQFRVLSESIPQLVWTTNPEGQMDYVNERWSAYTGQTPEQAYGSGWSAAIHPEDRSRVIETWSAAWSAGRIYETEYRLRRRDGQYRWFLARGVPLRGSQNRIERWFGTSTEIDEQKRILAALRESQERALLAVETAALGTYERDLLTNEITMNPACRQILGITQEHPPYDVARKSLYPEDAERVLSSVVRAFDPTLREVCVGEFRILRPDGSIRWVSGRGRVVFDDSTQPATPQKFFGVLFDITERKRLESELQRHAAHLEQLVQERTSKLQEMVHELEHFSYTITHDMRAPLRAMQGFGSILLGECPDCLPPVHQDLIRRIVQAADRMDMLITDALNFSKIVRQEFDLLPLDPAALLRGVIESYPQFQPPQAHVMLTGEFPPVCANKAGLTQVFSNLLGNAVKFVQPGKTPQIRVWTEQRGDFVRLWFEDNGIGIEKQFHDKIWGMFQRLDQDGEGTGIGLALVKKAVERMRGQVGVESEPGKGSRFWVDLRQAVS